MAGEVVAGARDLEYDLLILAFGSSANDFGTPGVVDGAMLTSIRREKKRSRFEHSSSIAGYKRLIARFARCLYRRSGSAIRSVVA